MIALNVTKGYKYIEFLLCCVLGIFLWLFLLVRELRTQFVFKAWGPADSVNSIVKTRPKFNKQFPLAEFISTLFVGYCQSLIRTPVQAEPLRVHL